MNIRKLMLVMLIAVTCIAFTGCGNDSLTGRWTEYKSEEYNLKNGEWVASGTWDVAEGSRLPTVAEFTSDGRFSIDGKECDFEIEDSYLRLYNGGYLETGLIHVEDDKLVIQARYDDELNVIYFRKN